MTTHPHDLESLAKQAAALLTDSFQNWRPPMCYVQFGSGFIADALFDQAPQELPLHRLPGMPEHHTPDREHPQLLFGTVQGIPILATRGHRHLYEGNGPLPVILPICTAKQTGASAAILIDGGLTLNPDLKPGSWLLLTDFINGHHCSPLDGNHQLLPNAFPDMTEALSQHLNSELINALEEVGVNPRLGVFYSRPGSQFCTVAEARLAQLSGADVVGHDLVMEIIMGHALGLQVSAFALATLRAPDNYSPPLTRENFLDACRFCSEALIRGLRKGIPEYLKK
ncbi:MAG: hypothetical protein IJJ26_01890 [Victivallales bacterium]|nr:hypothetical protein [Victivallales bacterium]